MKFDINDKYIKVNELIKILNSVKDKEMKVKVFQKNSNNKYSATEAEEVYWITSIFSQREDGEDYLSIEID